MNGVEERTGGFVALCRLAFGSNGSERQMEQFRACLEEAKRRGATDPLLAHRLQADNDDPFETVREAGKEVQVLLREFTAMTDIESPTLADVAGAEFDPGVPDGLARQADLDDLRRKHADLLQLCGPSRPADQPRRDRSARDGRRGSGWQGATAGLAGVSEAT